VPYLVERKKPAPGDQPQTAPPDDEDGPDDDEIVEDFEMRFAKELLQSVSAGPRNKVIAAGGKTIARLRGEEEKKLVVALSQIGVDWSGPAGATSDTANLDVSVQTSPRAVVAGQDLSVSATVKNNGTGVAYRVLPRLVSDDGVFQDVELPIGKVGPGETKTFTAKVKVPTESFDRVDRLALEVREARNAVAHASSTEVKIEALPRPVFAYSWQLVDEGNGDGLVQRGEKYKLQVMLKNTGTGPTKEATVLLRNSTGDGVVLEKSRFEFKDPIAPGQTKELEFPLATDATLKADEVVLELTAYDGQLDVQASDKMKFKVSASVVGLPQHGEVTTKQAIAIRSGAADEASIVGGAAKGASYVALGNYGTYTKVKLTSGGSKLGFIPQSALISGGSGTSSFAPYWHSTPPSIAIASKALDTTAASYKLQGSVTDETHVEDVYIFVANQGAKIDNRKVFYRSNRGGKDPKQLDFSADLPLWPGSNMVTVVARENADVRSIKTLILYRDPPRTAQAQPPSP
jgi:carboxyl-terminal processing protease